jgi:hypothetical protein
MRITVPALPAFRCTGLLLPLLLLAVPLAAAADADRLAPSEKAASEWIRVRLETARLESQWLAAKPNLQSLVGSMKDRAQGLEERRDLLKAKTAKDRDDLAGLRDKNQATADDLKAADQQLQALSARLRDLRPFLPPRLSAALELSYRSLGNANLGVGERMQLVMTMLNRCLEFNRTIAVGC